MDNIDFASAGQRPVLVMKLPEDLVRQTRRIRNIELTHSDLEPLLSSDRKKIPGVLINAYSAVLQDGDDNRDYVVFSSWIAPLATGQVRPSPGHGSIEGHILQATTTGVPADELIARFRWLLASAGNPLPRCILSVSCASTPILPFNVSVSRRVNLLKVKSACKSFRTTSA